MLEVFEEFGVDPEEVPISEDETTQAAGGGEARSSGVPFHD